jgi:hypothetical protein
MNAETPILSTDECLRFIRFWTEVTEQSRTTLVAILPDGPTKAATFAVSEDEAATSWITNTQSAGWNIYFQANATSPDCVKKPSKAEIRSINCRHVDIDPVDTFPLEDERDRLQQLAEQLRKDSDAAPTAIIFSGNGIQALWATVAEAADPDTVGRIENENKNIATALGGDATANCDRLLRLPGTINFPGQNKIKKGRGVSKARLVSTAPNVYQPHQAAALARHLEGTLSGTEFVRKPQKSASNGGAGAGDLRWSRSFGQVPGRIS